MVNKNREKLKKEGENFINYHLLPYLKLNYPHLVSKLLIGLSGSVIYGEPDENSDIDIDIIINDIDLERDDYINLGEDIKKIIDRTLYEDIDISILPLSNLGVFDIKDGDINSNLLDSGYILENIKIVYTSNNWFNKLRENIRKKIFGNLENRLRNTLYFWIYSSINFISNVKPLLNRGDFVSYDSFFYECLLNLSKFVYLINNEFFPPKKWFFYSIKKLPLFGELLTEYFEKINSVTSREEKCFLFEELLIKLSDEINRITHIEIEKGENNDKSLKDFFEKTSISIGRLIKGEHLNNNVKHKNISKKKLRYKRVPMNDFIYFIPKEKRETFYAYEYLHFAYYVKSLGCYDEETNTIKITPLLSKFYRDIKKLEEENLIKEIEREKIYLKSIEENDSFSYYLNNSSQINNKIYKLKVLLFKFSLSPLLLFSLIFIPFRINLSYNYPLPTQELPKVTSPNPNWYKLENQPLEAIIKEIQKTDIRVYIGNTTAKIDEQEYKLDAAPYIKEGRTLVPLRFIAEGLGASVDWNGTERKVTLDYEGKKIELWIGKKEARVSGIEYSLDVPPEIKSGRTFVPIRFIAENFGSKVDWNSTLKEVSILKEKEYKKIDENSDADKDTLIFKEEKDFGTNPNDKNTIYNSLTDKELFELKKQYPELNIFAQYPDGITKLTLPEKAQLELNPVNAFNLDEKINDEIIVSYALNKNPDLKRGEELKSIWQEFNTKYSDFIEALKENLNLETINKIDKVGDIILNFKNLGLDEKLEATISKEYISRVIENLEEFDGIAPITAIFDKEFVNSNKEYFSQIKNSNLEFISEMLSKYPELTIEKQIETKKKYPEIDFSKRETFENPDNETGLTLLEKLNLSISPLNPYNFDNFLNDKNAIEYARAKGFSITKENVVKAVESIIKDYGEKLGSAVKQVTKLGITTPSEIDIQALDAKKQVEDMFSERTYKKKSDGTEITLEDLTSIERYKALIALNKTFAKEEINILLSQSKTLQEYVNNGKINELKELVDTLYKAGNSLEPALSDSKKEVKVKDTNTFKKYTNQLMLYDYNSGEIAIKLWQEANQELREDIKTHPKTTLAVVGVFGPVASAPEAQNEETFKEVVNYAKEHFAYHVETEKMLKEIADKEKDNDLRRPLENFDWLTLQFMFPNQSWTNAENVEKKQTFEEKLEHTFDYIEDMKTIREFSIKNFHDAKVQNHPEIVLDFLSNKLGSASIDYVINTFDPVNKGYGTPWGEKYTKSTTGWPTTTDLEIAQKIAYLFGKDKEKISDEEKILVGFLKGWAQVERIINMALNFPTMEIRGRGPPSTIKEDDKNLLFAYTFEKSVCFMYASNLKYIRLERLTGEKLPGEDSILKIRMPYCINSEMLNNNFGYVAFNIKNIPFDEGITIKRIEALLNNP